MKKTEVYENINYDNYQLDGLQRKKYYLLAGTGLFFIGYVFYANVIISICMILFALPLKKVYIKFKIKQQKELLRQQFRDLLYSLASSVAAGRQMSEALAEGNSNLSFMYDETAPIRQELRYMEKCIKESRTADEILLKDFAYRSGVEEIINFADVYSTCRTTGANVAEMISKAASVIMDKMTIDREIKSIIAQKKLETKIISAMPIVVIIFLNFVSPGYLNSLYDTVLGRIIMTASLTVMVISYYIMNKMVEVKV